MPEPTLSEMTAKELDAAAKYAFTHHRLGAIIAELAARAERGERDTARLRYLFDLHADALADYAAMDVSTYETFVADVDRGIACAARTPPLAGTPHTDTDLRTPPLRGETEGAPE